jgi:hypothetical protein
MNKRYTYITVIVLLLSSCGFLDDSPTTSLTDAAAYSTEQTLEANVTGLYSDLNVFVTGSFFNYLNAASRFTEFTGKRLTEDFTQTHDLTLYSTTTAGRSLYTYFYEGIGHCNNLLHGLESSPVDGDFKLRIEAETRFFRAFNYFCLTRLFGDLPIMDRPESLEDTFIGRSQYSEVYEYIVSDLKFASENMRTALQQESLNPFMGRANKSTAMAMLAKVYSYIACLMEYPEAHFYDTSKPGRLPDFSGLGIYNARDAWTLCLQCAEKVLTEDDAFRLEDNFTHLFRWDNANHPEDYLSRERMLVIQTTPNSQTSSIPTWTLWVNPLGTESANIQNSNAGRIRSSRWVFQKWAAKYGGTLDTVDGAEIYVDCPDPRFNATYFHTEVWGGNTTTGAMQAYSIYPASGKIKASPSSDPYIRKYFSAGYKTNNGYADFYVMRYAEVYLIAAEAAASLSLAKDDVNWKKAVDYVNVILERARKSVPEGTSESAQPAAWSYDCCNTREELVNEIMWEKFFELAFEGHEWFETHKRGAKWLVDNVCVPLNEFLAKAENSELLSEHYLGKLMPVDVQRVRGALLVAFPDYEIRYNTALSPGDQNDFYIK